MVDMKLITQIDVYIALCAIRQIYTCMYVNVDKNVILLNWSVDGKC